MDAMKKLEVILVSWYKDAPHLPATSQKWLSENIWWLTLIGVVLGAIGAVQVVMASFFVGALAGSVYGATLGGIAMLNLMLTLALAIVSLVLCAMAISPLRAMQKKGWSLLLIVLLVSALSAVIGLVLSWSVSSFIFAMLFAAVSGYFLYEIRSYFGNVHVRKRA